VKFKYPFLERRRKKKRCQPTDYKRLHLGISEPGVFRYRGRDVPHDHILPLKDASQNLLKEAKPILKKYGSKLKLHKYFHRLNSSQAFALNLFFSLFRWQSRGGFRPIASSWLHRSLEFWEPETVPDF